MESGKIPAALGHPFDDRTILPSLLPAQPTRTSLPFRRFNVTEFENPLPGVPSIESPFFERIFRDADAETRRVAKSLHEDGFAVIEFPEADIEALGEAVKRALHDRFNWERWRSRGFAQGSGMRLQDAWQYDENVRKLAANPQIISLLSRLYGRRAWPFQTLDFPVGTQQHYHSDSVHFSCIPERFMCGVWVALEDVNEDAGPLVYYPGSHKWPIYGNEHIGVCVSQSDRPVSQALYEEMWHAMVAQARIEPRHFVARKGQAIIWAANLLHGGARQKNRDLTRWSHVTHYFFDDCAYLSPMRSDVAYGSIWFRESVDISTGNVVPNMCAGHRVPAEFIQRSKPRARGLPEGFDAERYYLANPDVRADGMPAADHWLNFGRFEGRALGPD